MSVRTKSKSGLFLIELIIAILFFSVASAVCVQIFVNAHLLSEKSRDTSMAVVQSQSAAEALKGTNGSVERMGELLEAQISQGEDGLPVLTVNYDADWNPTQEQPIYQLTVVVRQAGELAIGDITVKKSSTQEAIYQLQVKKYLGE